MTLQAGEGPIAVVDDGRGTALLASWPGHQAARLRIGTVLRAE